MMEQVTDRELLWELAQKPIGDRRWQRQGGHAPLKPEYEGVAKEAGARASKKWLPAGKKSAADANRKAHADVMSRQTDLEDAVEAAGGKRGG